MEKLGDIIWDITKYLCGCAKQEVEFIYDLKENLQSLEAKWKRLEAMKKDVDAHIEQAEITREMQRSHQVSVWLKNIQDIQEDIEGIQVQGAQEIQNTCLSACCPKNCTSSYKFGKRVTKMLTHVDDLTTEGQRLGKDYQITHKLPRKLIDQIPLGETIGQDFIFSKVWNSIEANKVGVIGLYGTGGVGKTTLLKKIYNEVGKRRPDYFVIWVVVSKEPHLDRIRENIRKSMGIGDSTWFCCNNREEESAMILGALKRKKFVLLLDDVWEGLDLNLLGIPHPKDTNFESKVLFTTRLEDVCAKMQTQESFKVEFLKEKEALELFQMKVGEETLNSHPRIKVLTQEMAAECKGLPLALIVVGSAMAGVKDVETWECSKNILTSFPLTTTNLETRVFSILKLSYDQLPDDVHRICFLYCALYPEDYEIQVTDIIDKWIGEGLLQNDMTKSIQDIRNHGQSVILKLKLCCLLESVEDDIAVIRSFKIHDIIRDMALWIACDQDKRIKKIFVEEDAITTPHDDVEKWKIVERISIMKWEIWHLPLITCPNLVTLLLRNYGMVRLQNIKYMSKLKVLELDASSVHNLEGIGELVLLEYLSLVADLDDHQCPEELKNLKNLKVFNLYLRNVNISSIPLGVISSLEELKVLRVASDSIVEANSKAEVEFLEEAESLPKIEELNVEINTKNGLNKLLGSEKLQSCIYALRLWKLVDTIEMHLLLACFSKMKRLRQFAMFPFSVVESHIYDTHSLNMLQCVAIIGCKSLMHVTWLKYAPFLQLLFIGKCKSMKEVIKEEATKEEKEDSSSTFSSLVSLTLYDLPKLQSIHKTALPFPSLKAIKMAKCPNLRKLPLDSNSAKHKLALIQGEEDWWNSLEWNDPAAFHYFQSIFQPSDSPIFQDLIPAAGLDFISYLDFVVFN